MNQKQHIVVNIIDFDKLRKTCPIEFPIYTSFLDWAGAGVNVLSHPEQSEGSLLVPYCPSALAPSQKEVA